MSSRGSIRRQPAEPPETPSSVLSGLSSEFKENEVVSWQTILALATIVFCAFVHLCIWWPMIVSRPDCNFKDSADLHLKIKEGIASQFTSQSQDLWNHLNYIFDTLCNIDESCPKVLLLLNTERTKATKDCLVSEVAKLSSTVFYKEKYLVWKDSELACDDCLSQQIPEVRQYGTVVIDGLEKFHAQTAQKLHSFCDEHEPDFVKAFYLLTLTVDSDQGKAVNVAENAIRGLWPKMSEKHRDALIARLTSLVVFVKHENSSICN